MRVPLGVAVGLCSAALLNEKLCSAKYHVPSGYRTIREIITLSHDTRVFRLDLPKPSAELFMRPGSSLEFKLFDGSTFQSRYYTPVSPNGAVGYCDLVIKLMPQGRVTGMLWRMKPGEKLWVVPWEPTRERYKPNKYKHIGMLAGGVGLTPMLQMVREVVTNPFDHTTVSLLYVNKTPQDILLRAELDRLARQYPQKFKVTYCISRPTEGDGWKGLRGRITAPMLQATMPPPARDTALYVSGPDGFVNMLTGADMGLLSQWSLPTKRQPKCASILPRNQCHGLLGQLGYSKQVIVF
eukprot:TRINITY_DN94372_c0_g1_i1.p1 TRINITY_DN94372_c0_g1~~TRINITY_DN94372_c0_g1_i1.p1  ORF type:complete len:327 (+),score=25.86 TRINITY_DN94372_c0_g1_i1:94-981(+)